MRESAHTFEPIRYLAPEERGGGGTTIVTPKYLHGLDDNQLKIVLADYEINLGSIDLSSPKSRARAIAAIMQAEKGRSRFIERKEAPKPSFYERIRSAIVTDEDKDAVDAVHGIWEHMRHVATDPKPNGHFKREPLSQPVPSYSLAKIDGMEERLGSFIEENIAGRHAAIPLALQIDTFFDALDYKRIQVIQDTTEAERFDELALMGINPRQAAVSWGEIHRGRFVPTYHAVRGQDRNPERVGDIISLRREMVDQVLSSLDRRFSNFFRHNPEITQQAILQFFRYTPRRESYEDGELEAEQARFTYIMTELADRTLAERLGVQTDALPLSYDFLSSWQEHGVITPQYPVLETMNRNIRNGEQIDLYCCPNYSREKRKDGVEVFTFEGLEPGLGLTAERSFPFVVGLIDRVASIENHPPLNMRIGIADFEATPANTDMVKLSIDDFNGVLGQSIEQMIQYFQDYYGNNADVQVRRVNVDTEPIGEWSVTINRGGDIAHLSFGAITKSYEGKIDGYRQDIFNELVATKREELAQRSMEDPTFQHVLDEGLTTRLGIMLDWPNGKENEQVKALATLYNQMTETNFAQAIFVEGIFAELIREVNAILVRGDTPEREKDMICRDIIIKWLQRVSAKETTQEQDSEKHATNALQGIRARTAEQLAEYVVMTILMKQSGSGAHFTADATAMWEMAGKTLRATSGTTPRMNMKGGYEGA